MDVSTQKGIGQTSLPAQTLEAPKTNDDAVKLNDIIKIVVGAALSGLVVSSLLYVAGYGLTAAGSSLAGRCIFGMRFSGTSHTLVVVGDAVTRAGRLLFTGVSAPAYFLGVTVPKWIANTALPYLKGLGDSAASRITAIASPCFQALAQKLGVVGEVTGQAFDWVVYRVFADGIKLIDKCIQEVWKGIVTKLAYALTTICFPGAQMLRTVATKATTLSSSMTEWLVNKVTEAYDFSVNRVVKPAWNTVVEAVKRVFAKVIGQATAISADSAETLHAVAKAIAEEEGVSVAEFLAAQSEMLAEFVSI